MMMNKPSAGYHEEELITRVFPHSNFLASDLNPFPQHETAEQLSEAAKTKINWHLEHHVGIETSHASNYIGSQSYMLLDFLHKK